MLFIAGVVNWPTINGDLGYVLKQRFMKIYHNIRSFKLKAVSLSENLPKSYEKYKIWKLGRIWKKKMKELDLIFFFVETY